MGIGLVAITYKRGGTINFDEIFSYSNLYQSYLKCCNGVRWKASIQRFVANAPLEVYKIYNDLQNEIFKSKGTSDFTIRERGKIRNIQAVHISERVVQKCLCNYALSPLLEKSLIYDNSASQKGKGTEFARDRLYKHLQRYYREHGSDGYVLKFDFKGYFNNIPHWVVIEQIERLDLDDKTKRLARYLIKQNKGDVGLGIGAEISQVMGIVYANSVDHLIKDRLGCKYYARYMDDGYIIHPDKDFLKYSLELISAEVERIGGTLSERKTQIIKLSKGFEHLKTRYYLTETGRIVCKPNKDNITRARRNLKKFKKKLNVGEMTMEQIECSYQSRIQALNHCDAWHTIQSLNKLYGNLFAEVNDVSNTNKQQNDTC